MRRELSRRWAAAIKPARSWGWSSRGCTFWAWIAGLVYLAAAVALTKSVAALARPAALAVILMLLLTIASQWVSPRMADLRTQMGSVDRTPADNPLRIEFNRLHKISVRLEGAVLLLGIAALFLTVRE